MALRGIDISFTLKKPKLSWIVSKMFVIFNKYRNLPIKGPGLPNLSNIDETISRKSKHPA